MVRVGADLNYMAIVKEIKNDFAAGEARTDVALNSYTDEEATISSVELIYNQNVLNLEVLKQIYQLNSPARNDDTGGGRGNHNNDNKLGLSWAKLSQGWG